MFMLVGCNDAEKKLQQQIDDLNALLTEQSNKITEQENKIAELENEKQKIIDTYANMQKEKALMQQVEIYNTVYDWVDSALVEGEEEKTIAITNVDKYIEVFPNRTSGIVDFDEEVLYAHIFMTHYHGDTAQFFIRDINIESKGLVIYIERHEYPSVGSASYPRLRCLAICLPKNLVEPFKSVSFSFCEFSV